MIFSLQRNLFALYLLKFSHWFMLIMPIIIPFYMSHGLTMHEIFLIQAGYSTAMILLEIPTGYLSDVWGRKKTLLSGTILAFSGFLIYDFSTGFWGFLSAELIMGLGASFVSGTDAAVLYDSLQYAQKKDTYLQHEGRITSIGNYSESIAGICGGLLALVSLHFPFYIQTIVAFLGIPATLMIVNPPIETKKRKPGWKDIFQVVTQTLHTNKILRNYIFLSSCLGACTLTMAWFAQPYFKYVDLPLFLYGVMWTVLNIIVGVFSDRAYKIREKFGDKKILIFTQISILSGFVFASLVNHFVGLLLIFVFYIMRGFVIVWKDNINKLSTSDSRATVLSVRNFVIRLLFSLLGPLWGWLSDTYTFQLSYLLCGIVYFVIVGYWTLKVWNMKSVEVL